METNQLGLLEWMAKDIEASRSLAGTLIKFIEDSYELSKTSREFAYQILKQTPESLLDVAKVLTDYSNFIQGEIEISR